ncbi:DUF2164 domain-containing protein [Caulobacter sp. CCUG 60055]|uniref:DUF2164 domain-containing protein n=1 Tax=Caulobacter sp. CCUG 60055 TaxID=2100090 RepID=UPI001FA79A3C|nr:DUF2164 domain-containing protein [Caulobacter sp. CCUG 60055]MBQ1543435.1 DUF2164 domain-containing protein [Caulobacteraceae bacterium]MCI3179670.1 DUF2164 domain-containing protein [Caulobacter sp. CCUG 60055]
MARIEFDRPTREMLARQIVRHLKETLDVEIAPFDAVDLLDFLAETLGPHFYNQGLTDAQAVIQSRVEAIVEAVSDLEKPVKR